MDLADMAEKKRFPCLIYGFAVMIMIIAGGVFEPEYESLAGMLYYFFLIPVLGFMFWLPHEILFSLNGGRDF
jgi:hypothetical protein